MNAESGLDIMQSVVCCKLFYYCPLLCTGLIPAGLFFFRLELLILKLLGLRCGLLKLKLDASDIRWYSRFQTS